MSILGPDISKAVETCLGNFLEKWRRDTDGGTMTGHPWHDDTMKPFLLMFLATVPHLERILPMFTPRQVMLFDPEKIVLIQWENVHPKIQELIQDYVRHFRSIQFCLLLKAANVTNTTFLGSKSIFRTAKTSCAIHMSWENVMADIVGMHCMGMSQLIIRQVHLLTNWLSSWNQEC